jgi:hypothetical protein
MLRYFLILIIITLSLNAAGCLCTSEISKIFKDIQTYVVDDYVDPTSDNIEDTLIPQINTNKQSIDAQNEILEKSLKAEKLKALEAKKLVFLLEKLYNIENLQ